MKRLSFKKVVKTLLFTLLFAGYVTLCVIPIARIVEANNLYNETELPQFYRDCCEVVGEIYCICPELLMAMIEQESQGDPNATGALGEQGLLQIDPKWHYDRMEKLGVTDLYAPYSNILVGADYLSELFEKYQDLPTVLMVYNGSSDAVERGERYDLTEYAETIINRSAELERAHKK